MGSRPDDSSHRRGSRTSPLYSVLGLGPNATVDDLRWAYERQMAIAIRAEDFSRARALSRAFDALPAAVRAQVYPTTHSRPTAVTFRYGRGGAIRAQRSQHGDPRPASQLKERFVIYVLGIPGAVVAITAFMIHFHLGDAAQKVHDSRPVAVVPFSAPANGSPRYPIDPAAEAGRRRRAAAVIHIPLGVAVNGQGFTQVICQRRPGRAGYVVLARPGSVVRCRNGARPVVAG